MWYKYRTSFFLAFSTIALLSFFWFFPTFAFIFFISSLLMLLLEPIVNRLEVKITRGLASAITVVITLILGMVAITIISPDFIPTVEKFISELPLLAENLQKTTGTYTEEYLGLDLSEIWADISSTYMTILKNSLAMVFSLFGKLIDFVVIIFVTFYMLKDVDKIDAFIANLFPAGSENRVITLIVAICRSLQIYVRSQLIMCGITGIVVFIYYTINDLPYGSIFAVLSSCGELIPILGPTIASVIGILLTASQYPDMAIQTAIFYFILTQVNHNVIYPSIIGKSLNLHPLAIILGVIFGGEILGAAGMFLAVPFIVIFKHVILDIHAHK